MRPKELQAQLGITADRIKLYKREELFFPENPPSGSRGTDYTESDLECLRLLEVLTKSGLTCGDIKKLQDGENTLAEVAGARIQSIQADMDRKRNALQMLSTLIADQADYATFDTDRYWQIIREKEAAGDRFVTVVEKKQGRLKRNRHLIHGLVAAASPVPMLIYTWLWATLILFDVGMDLLKYQKPLPFWLEILSLLPLLVSPILCCLFIVIGILRRKERLAWLCVVLSCVGLAKNVLLFWLIMYIGSRY